MRSVDEHETARVSHHEVRRRPERSAPVCAKLRRRHRRESTLPFGFTPSRTLGGIGAKSGPGPDADYRDQEEYDLPYATLVY